MAVEYDRVLFSERTIRANIPNIICAAKTAIILKISIYLSNCILGPNYEFSGYNKVVYLYIYIYD